MIEPMVKYAFLMHQSSYNQFLTELKQLGMVHIDGSITDTSADIQAVFKQIKEVDAVIKQLVKLKVTSQSISNADGQSAFNNAQQLIIQKDKLQTQRSQLIKDRQLAEPWGEFNHQIINTLATNGIVIHAYTIASRHFEKALLKDEPLFVINQQNGITYFIVIEQDAVSHTSPLPDAEPIQLPEFTFNDICAQIESIDNEIITNNNSLIQLAINSLEALKDYRHQLQSELSNLQAHALTKEDFDGQLRTLQGWIPTKNEADLTQFIENSDIAAIRFDAISENDKPPILLRNNAFSRLFEPIGQLFSLPAYVELDLTPFFAPFFMLFFGFCLGDAGYGLLMIAAAILVRHKLQLKYKPLASLAIWLGLATVVFGALTGTFFGIKLTDFQLFESFKTMTLNDQQMFKLALAIGVVQVVFGMIIRVVNIVRQNGWQYSLSTTAWIIVIISTIAFAAIDHLTTTSHCLLSTWHWVILGICSIAIFIINDLKRNIFINIGAGIWDTYNMVTGFAGDVLSYIRLFALGMSGAILGMVFNQLAIKMSPDIIVIHEIVMILILLFGHTLNIFMSILGSFVHPMRLTFVEFYKNAGFMGGGKAYSPFKN